MDGILQTITDINEVVNGIVWGAPALILIIFVGLYYTIRTGGFQFRRFGLAMKNTVGKIFSKEAKNQEVGQGEVSPMQAVSTALAGAFGVGNIAGVTSAITVGGPGAVFWMVLSALLGMATKYAEVFLSITYRERNDYGDWVGGPMYYIKNGLKKHWHWLATFFAVAVAFAALGTGNAIQVGNIADATNTAIQQFIPEAEAYAGTITVVIGIILMIIVGIILIGGVQRIGQAAETIVPPMAILYSLACLIAIITNWRLIPAGFGLIIEGAFNPAAISGGLAGATIKTALEMGVKRGVFSNEAGLGTGPMAHAASIETNPVKQGYFAILEVFSTVFVCLINALVIIICVPKEIVNYGVEGTTALNAYGLATVFGDKLGATIVAIALALFAFTTIIGWGLYGIRCAEYVFGTGGGKIYRILYIVTVFVGATLDLGFVWGLSDTANGFMIIPNCIALILLSDKVIKGTKEYFIEYDAQVKESRVK